MRLPVANPEHLAAKRVIFASFAAGVGAMLVVGLVAPVAAQGGLSLASAEAHALEQRAPIIEPLDVAAIEATLAQAERSMDASRAITDGTIQRLDALSGR